MQGICNRCRIKVHYEKVCYANDRVNVEDVKESQEIRPASLEIQSESKIIASASQEIRSEGKIIAGVSKIIACEG